MPCPQRGLGRAHCRAVDSIGNVRRSELRRGCAAESRADFVHKLSICLKELAGVAILDSPDRRKRACCRRRRWPTCKTNPPNCATSSPSPCSPPRRTKPSSPRPLEPRCISFCILHFTFLHFTFPVLNQDRTIVTRTTRQLRIRNVQPTRWPHRPDHRLDLRRRVSPRIICRRSTTP